MAFVALVFLLLGLVGWSVEEEGETAAAPPSGESGPSSPGPGGSETKAPPIVLVSAAGTQVAVAESSCVFGSGSGLCIDTMDQRPEDLSVVRPGEEVVVRLRGASVTQGNVTVRPLPDCKGKTVTKVKLEPGPETRWRVDLPAGQYELQVFARFEAADGRSGDASGSLGIALDTSQPPGIVPVPDTFVAC